jgi:hypothetical protein
VTPKKLKQTFEQLTLSPDEKLRLIVEFWATLDKIEKNVNVEEKRKGRKAITFST